MVVDNRLDLFDINCVHMGHLVGKNKERVRIRVWLLVSVNKDIDRMLLVLIINNVRLIVLIVDSPKFHIV